MTESQNKLKFRFPIQLTSCQTLSIESHIKVFNSIPLIKQCDAFFCLVSCCISHSYSHYSFENGFCHGMIRIWKTVFFFFNHNEFIIKVVHGTVVCVRGHAAIFVGAKTTILTDIYGKHDTYLAWKLYFSNLVTNELRNRKKKCYSTKVSTRFKWPKNETFLILHFFFFIL